MCAGLCERKHMCVKVSQHCGVVELSECVFSVNGPSLYQKIFTHHKTEGWIGTFEGEGQYRQRNEKPASRKFEVGSVGIN